MRTQFSAVAERYGNIPSSSRGSIADVLRSVSKQRVLHKGSGKKGNARAAVVRQVMKERGCSLPQASKIVKEEGLY